MAGAKLFALSCIDPRFRDAFEKFIQKKFRLKPTEYDLKTDAGGVKEIALETTSGDWIVENAEIAYTKHGIRTFVLCNHIDCAHYGGSNHFSGFEDEKRNHGDDLKKASAILREKFFDIKIYAYMVYKEQRPRETFVFQQVAV